jgi:hypothetical protein
MGTHSAALFALLVAAPMANLPFATSRLATWMRLAGWLLLYFAWVAACAALQATSGIVAPLGWQGWFITSSFFAVLAFPGLTWRYLVKR